MRVPHFKLQADRHPEQTEVTLFVGASFSHGDNTGTITFRRHEEWELLRDVFAEAARRDLLALDVQELDLRG